MWDTFYLKLGRPGDGRAADPHLAGADPPDGGRRADGRLPIHAVMPGRCYRRETPDARHLAIFHQIEGLVVDRDITFGDLAGTIETFTGAYFGPDIHSRLRPALLPLHRALGRIRDHLHHLPWRRMPDLLADRVD